jgi:hypothetical protein
MMRFNKWATITLSAAFAISAFSISAGGQTTVLYNGALGAGNDTPDSAAEGSWLEYTAGAGSPTVSSSGGQTTLDTTVGNLPDPPAPQPYSDEAGYSNYTPSQTLVNSNFPALNPTPGFSVSFDVQILSETHGTNDTDTNRAGFDVIVLGSDKKGVELGFWTNDIWAQELNSNVFTRDPAEDSNIQRDSTALDNTSLTHYTLTVIGSSYSLSTGATNPVTILTGSTHDYSSYTGTEPNPYSLTNFVFIGDDTMDADAKESFTDLAVVTVPEPATLSGLLALGLVGLARRRRR